METAKQSLACAFTGHRPMRFAFGYDEDDEQCRKLKKVLTAQIWAMSEQLGVTTFYTGMALGVDIWAAEIVLEMKKTDNRIRLVAVLPCDTQAQKWSVEQRERYYAILSKADAEKLISYRYTPSCMFERNRYMVDHADYLIAVYDGNKRGGTAYTVEYAKQRKVQLVTIHPDQLEVETPIDMQAKQKRSSFRVFNSRQYCSKRL